MTGAGRIGAALRALLTRGRPAQRGPVAVGDAPAAWADYAQRVAQRLAAALDGTDAAASRLRAQLERDASRSEDDEDGDAPPALRLKAWLDRRGNVERVESAPAFAPDVAADLRSALVGRRVGAPPPRGMTQPVIVRVRVAVQDSSQTGQERS
ncbi:hypothetical protein WK57_30890 [Burkholderia ubonensis]|uniref:Uncharacterized protein n=1 Tax=Burkholderia ubonensis TaxID=101571 RepID=A0AA40R5B0_9BURK|nr:hypothetical protein [Burkholderia ubonensis]KVG34996.1 hypothetical protein WJ31_21520 [Burkholderia ubonensis]KVU14238.1 hypothetical protein WK64_11010 [Burkholderia ubonensis]KWC59899.1 hypothetical protein WL54_17515 [Burkholderia ubonensis]KWZ53389.1 hypothetical protein WK57_30890 [Burkholderia ubonensis]OJA60537.1 hypothetical protein BGV69_04405 [Burkholderia ubonensis]